MRRSNTILILAAMALATTGCGASDRTQGRHAASEPHITIPEAPVASAIDPLETARSEARAEAARLIRDYRTIPLTPEQENIKTAALSAIPAPCCDEFSIATCCCPCNLAKAVWGLAHRMIAEDGAGVTEVQGAVKAWLASANPDGFRGDACFSPGGCNRAFHADGCGGMSERTITD